MPVSDNHGTAMMAKIIPIRPSPQFCESNDSTTISFAHLKCCHRLSTQPHFISTKKPDRSTSGRASLSLRGADCRWTPLEGRPPAPIQPAMGNGVPQLGHAPPVAAAQLPLSRFPFGTSRKPSSSTSTPAPILCVNLYASRDPLPLWCFSFACCRCLGAWLRDSRCLRVRLRGDRCLRAGLRGENGAGIDYSRAK